MWNNTPFFQCFLEDVLSTGPGDKRITDELQGSIHCKGLSLDALPEDLALTLLHTMKAAAEATLDGTLPGWLRFAPEDAEGQRSYLFVVAELLYYIKLDLGLLPPLPPPRGPHEDPKLYPLAGLRSPPSRPYWMYEPFLEDVIARCRDDAYLVRHLERCITDGELRGYDGPDDLSSLTGHDRMLRAMKAVAEDAQRGAAPGWDRYRPGDADGRKLYCDYVADLLPAIDEAIKMNDFFLEEYKKEEEERLGRKPDGPLQSPGPPAGNDR